MDKMMQLLDSNLKFTKAIYRGSKKTFEGPGREAEVLHSMSIGTSTTTESVYKKQTNLLLNVQNSLDLDDGQQSIKSVITASSTPSTLPFSSCVSLNASTPHAPNSLASTVVRSSSQTSTLQSRPSLRRSGSRLSEITQAAHQYGKERRRVQIWRFLEDKHSSRAAAYYYRVRSALLAFSILIAGAEVLSEEFRGGVPMTCVQLVVETLFGIDLLVRFCSCRNYIAFWADLYNVIDLLSVSPCVLRICTLVDGQPASAETVALFGIVPILRFLKYLRHFETFHLLLNAFLSAATVMPILLFALFLITSSFAVTIYYVEPRSNIPSLPLALYFTICTISTVGYGDFAPKTPSGRVCASLLAVLGPMYMAMPIGIIGTTFSRVWEDRHRLFILQRMRKCVTNAGYSPKELKHVFELLDQNGDGSLDYSEFIAWLDVMDVDVKGDFARVVFESFDADNEGSIEFDEFLRGLFPQTHTHIHRMATSSAVAAVKNEDASKLAC
jgi:hypothetical protein